MKKTNHALSRRSFLVGAGAAVGAASLVGGFGTTMAQQMGSSSPRRFVFVLRVNGFDSNVLMSSQAKEWVGQAKGSPLRDEIWWGTQYGDDRGYGTHDTTEVLPNSLSGASGLNALESMGMLSRATALFGLGSPITGGGHSASHGVLASARTLSGQPGGQTLDDFLSRLESVRGTGDQRTPVPALRVGVGGQTDGVVYSNSASAPGQALPTLLSTESVWNAYIRPLVDPGGVDNLQRRARLLDVAMRDVEQALKLNPDRVQLQRYRASVQAQLIEQDIFKQRIDDAMRDGLSMPPSLEQTLAAQSPLDRVDAQMRHIATSLEAGLTNVALLGVGAGGFNVNFGLGEYSSTNGAHQLCHEFSEGMERSAAIRQELRAAWTRELDAVASLAAHLDSIPEKNGEGTMLDNTVIIYLPDNGVGHHARDNDYPLLMIGGENMGLRTGGSTIFFPGYQAGDKRVELSNLWNTLVHLASGQDTSVSFEAAKNISDKLIPELMTV